MKNKYILCFKIYRTILFLLLPLFLFAIFMVGTAGHNSNMKNSDYFIFAFIIITSIVLTTLKKIDNKENLKGKTLNLTAKLLVTLGVIIVLFGIFEQIKIYLKNSFTIGDIITTIILLSLIILSVILLIGLIKNKV